MTDQRREENLEKIRTLGQQVGQGGELTHTFAVDFTADDGTNYKGTFIVHRPTMNDYMQMGVLKGKYIQQFIGNEYVHPDYIDATIKYLAHMLSTMSVVVDRCPEWFLHPEKLNDFGILDHVFTRYQEWLNSFRHNNTDEHQGDSPTAE